MQNTHKPSLFAKHSGDQLISACCTHVDDLVLCFAPDEEAETAREEFGPELNVGTWDKKGLGTFPTGPMTVPGRRGKYTLSLSPLVETLVTLEPKRCDGALALLPY